MAEFLVAARDLDSGYRRGDPITVQVDGHVWGNAETLPDFYIVKVPSVTVTLGRQLVAVLYEDAQPGDREFEFDVEDRIIRRHRVQARMVIDDLPNPKQRDLTESGITTLSYGQAKQAYKALLYNRATDTVEVGGEVLP